MTTTAPGAGEPALPPVTRTPRSSAPPQTAAATGARRAARRGLWTQATENPLLTLFGTVIIALLGFSLTSTNFRIGDIHGRIDDIHVRFDDIHVRFDDIHVRIDDTNARIDRLEDRLDRLEERIDRLDERIDRLDERIDRLDERMDARFAALEHSVAGIDRKLTALIAALNKTSEVDAAVAGDVSGIGPGAPVGQSASP